MKKSRFQARRLRLKIWDYAMLIGITLSIIILFMVSIEYATRAKTSQVKLVHDVMVKISENHKRQFDDYVDEKIRTLRALAVYPDIYEMDEMAQKEFIYGRSHRWGFNHIFVVDMSGDGYYIEENIHRDQSGEKFFYDIKNNKTFITEPFYTGDGKAIMTICVSIYDIAGEKVGILCGAVDLNDIQQVIGKNEVILEGNSYILSENGTYLTSNEKSDIYNKVSIYNIPDTEISLIEEAFAEKEDKLGTITLNGIEYQTYVTYLKDYHWVIVQNISTEKIIERYAYLDWMKHTLLFFIALLICCVIRMVYCWKKSDKKIYTDTLTKCSSRAACLEVLDYLQKERKQKITIIYMDLNHFKWVNDTYGHDYGDELLKIFVDVLMQTLGKEGFVGRMGGDEFIAVLTDVTEEEITELWKQVEEKLTERSKELSFDYQISSSYGYASREVGEQESLNTILQMADAKMYENKSAKKRV